MSNSALNWGIIGSSPVVEEFLEAIEQIHNQDVKGIHSTNFALANTIAKKNRIECFTSVEDLLNSPYVDAVYVASPNSEHFYHAKQSLLAGKHVLVEKPFCTDSNQTKELLEIASNLNLHVSENMWICALPGLQEFVNQINKGEIGQIESVEIYVGFDSLGRRLKMSKLNVLFRRFTLKLLPRLLLDFSLPWNLNGLDKNDFLETVPHFSRKKMQGALMDFGIYAIAILQLLSSNPTIVYVRSRKINGVDVWTSIKFKEGNTIYRLSCSLFLSERNFLKVRGARGFLFIDNIFQPTKIIKKTKGKPSQEIHLPAIRYRFHDSLIEFEVNSKLGHGNHSLSRDIFSTFKLLDLIKSNY